MEAVVRACQRKRLNLNPVIVVSSKDEAGGIEKARALGIETVVVRPGDYRTREEFGKALLAVMEKYELNWVSQNGWLPLTPKNVFAKYAGRIINQHPGPLDPGRVKDFGGKGMYGSRVSCARVAYEWLTEVKNPWTEATVHRGTEKYDEGELILTSRVEFEGWGREVTIAELTNEPSKLKQATEELQERLLPVEHETVIEALAMVARGEKGLGRRDEILVPEENWKILEEAKRLAIDLYPEG